MTTTTARRVLTALVAVALVLTVVGPAGAAPNQYAQSIGTATANPRSGAVSTAPVIVASALCPAGSAAVNGFVDSATAGLSGAVAIAANTTDLANLATSGMSFSFNLLDIAASQGKTLVNGRYELSVVCLPDVFSAPVAQFDAVFTVTGGASATSPGTTWTFDVGGNVTTTTTSIDATPPVQARFDAGITLTATVTPAAAGTVQFVDVPTGAAATNLGTAVQVDPATGRAALPLSALATPPADGPRVFRALFTPADATKFAASASSDLAYRIIGANQVATTTTLATSPEVSVVKGNPLTLTATVAQDPVTATPPAGTVQFFDGTTQLGQATVSNGTASLSLKPDTAGTLDLFAAFTPADPALVGSSSPHRAYLVSEPLTEGPFLGLLKVSFQAGSLESRDVGLSTNPFQTTAPRACPNGSSALNMRISGPGAWDAGFPVNSDGFYEKANDQVPTLQTIADVSSLNNAPIVPGLYILAATCRVSLIDRTATGFFIGQIWFYDDTHWMNQDPAIVGIPTSTALDVSPAGRVDLGSAVTVTVTMTPVSAPGTVTFLATSDASGVTTVGSAPIAAGRATLTTKTLPLGLYYLTATYVPQNAKTHNASTSGEVVFVVAKPVPPLPQSRASVVGTPQVGRTLTCAAAFANATSRGYAWFSDGSAVSGAGKVAYTLKSADRGHLISCRASATNTGGTVYRDSAAVTVKR